MTPMGAIDLSNGHFTLPDKLTLSAGLELAVFEKAFGKGSFQPRWRDPGSGFEEHFLSTPVLIEQELYSFTFFFKYGRLVCFQLHVEAADQTRRLMEDETYQYYRDWLDRVAGTQRVYDWGSIDLYFDPKSMYGSISVQYNQA